MSLHCLFGCVTSKSGKIVDLYLPQWELRRSLPRVSGSLDDFGYFCQGEAAALLLWQQSSTKLHVFVERLRYLCTRDTGLVCISNIRCLTAIVVLSMPSIYHQTPCMLPFRIATATVWYDTLA